MLSLLNVVLIYVKERTFCTFEKMYIEGALVSKSHNIALIPKHACKNIILYVGTKYKRSL